MPRGMERTVLETGLRLDINQLIRDGVLQPDEVTEPSNHCWFNDDGQQIAQARISSNMTTAGTGTMHIVGPWIDQTIRLAGYRRRFGGRQWYFVCPVMKTRVSVLWSLPGQRFFAGRKAWGDNIAYRSQFYGPGMRARYMATKLCNRIGAPGTLWEWKVPPKPPGMRRKTYERLANRCKSYWDEATFMPTKFDVVGGVV